MGAAIRFVLWLVARLVLSLRYRIRLRGGEQLQGLTGGTLVLPNHPAYIDPPVVFTTLWRPLHPRPLLFDGNFQNPVLYPLMQILRAVPLPDLERPSLKARAQAEAALQEMIAGLRRGETFILWPAGSLSRDGQEHLGGSQAVSTLLNAVPEINLVLVRTRGLWGSMFSFAPTWSRPKLLGRLRAGIGILLSNLFFFTPRRPVEITVEKVHRDQLPGIDRATLNPWLERWYNGDAPEAPTFVPYHFLFGKRTFDFPTAPPADPQAAQVTPEVRAEVVRILEQKLKRPLTEAEQTAGTDIAQLGMDSLDRMELTLEVEQRFGFSTDQSPATLGDLWLLAQGLAHSVPAAPAPKAWFADHRSNGPLEIHGDTIAEAFVHRALASAGDVVAADDLSGVLTYRRMLAGALALSKRLRALPGKHVGVLLPASVAGDVAFLALHLAGKIPVMINWTTGPSNVEHAVRLLDLKHVVTSERFIDRLEENLLQALQRPGAAFVFLEELRAEIGRIELLRTLLRARLQPGSIRKHLPPTSPEEPAVVLFTSGSEKAPKAVPLTHRNLLVNQRDCLTVFGLTREDAVLGFLPPFHSFGLSMTGLLPLLSGLRVVRHPDPTAAAVLTRKIADYRPTLVAGTPTFINAILDRAKDRPEQLQSLRYLFLGAEKCPEYLLEKAKALTPRAGLLEGYGITECSPVISANPPAAPRPGTVGVPLENVTVQVVELTKPDPPIELGADLPTGQMGMLLISGPSVFPGYLGDEAPPFVERNGRRWYITGDLASRDADGYLRLEGRLKRFLKIGAEMVSLPALEAPFVECYPPDDEGPRVAIEGLEEPRRIVLFTTFALDLAQANRLLHEKGFRGIMRLDEVRRLDKLPTLGTGKADYKTLRAQLA